VGVNRKLLLGILIVFAVGFFLYQKSKKTNAQSSDDFASTADESIKKQTPVANPVAANKPVIAEAPIARIPNQVEVPKSGKYAVIIPKTNSSIQEDSARRDQFLAQNRTGLVIDSSDQKFVLMKLRAAKEKPSDDSNRTLDHQLFPIDLKLAQKVLVEDESYPVVYRESNGRIGLLTGIILIQTSENSEAEKLALNYPMDLQIYDPSIGLASYKVHTGEGLYEVYDRIKKTERIRSITVEVLDSYKGY
jgi:hypothetical protein